MPTSSDAGTSPERASGSFVRPRAVRVIRRVLDTVPDDMWPPKHVAARMVDDARRERAYRDDEP